MFEFAMKLKTAVLRVLVLAGAGLGMAAGAMATPVTFGFEAEVIDVDVLAAADLPFTVENGDALKGQFSFEPVDAQPAPGVQPGPIGASSRTDTIQEFGFSVTINTTVVSSSRYWLRVTDNARSIDVISFSDRIALQTCTALDDPQCQPETIPGSDDISWGFLWTLSADASVLDGPDISDDLSVWHQFVPGILSLNFQEVGSTGVLRVNAQVTSISIVPEPSSLCLVLLFCIAISAKRYSLFGK